MFGVPALLDTITSSFQAGNYSVHHLPFFSHFSKWRKHSERGRLGHGNSGHTSIPGSRHELQAGTTPFLATATRGFPSKNPPDRFPVLLKSRSRNEFLADLLRPHAALVEKTRRNRRMRGCAGGRPPRERGRPELHPGSRAGERRRRGHAGVRELRPGLDLFAHNHSKGRTGSPTPRRPIQA